MALKDVIGSIPRGKVRAEGVEGKLPDVERYDARTHRGKDRTANAQMINEHNKVKTRDKLGEEVESLARKVEGAREKTQKAEEALKMRRERNDAVKGSDNAPKGIRLNEKAAELHERKVEKLRERENEYKRPLEGAMERHLGASEEAARVYDHFHRDAFGNRPEEEVEKGKKETTLANAETNKRVPEIGRMQRNDVRRSMNYSEYSAGGKNEVRK